MKTKSYVGLGMTIVRGGLVAVGLLFCLGIFTAVAARDFWGMIISLTIYTSIIAWTHNAWSEVE